MKTKFLLPLLFLFQLSAFSQPAIQWQKCLGGSDFDAANSIRQTTDGGYIVAGWTASNDGDVSGNHDNSGNISDYWIVKLNSSGVIQWQKCLGGTGNDIATCAEQTIDGGYIVAGYSASNNGNVSGNHGQWDYWIVKLDTGGSIQWQKSLGGQYSDEPFSIQQTIDSGYIVAGYSTSNDGDVSSNRGGEDYCIVKLTNSGSIQWQKCLGGTSDDQANSIQQTTDGGFIIAGTSSSNDSDVSGNHGNGDCWIVKLTSNGALQWQKCFGGTSYDWATSIQQTTDGGYIVAGTTSSNDSDVSGNHGSYDYWVFKLDSSNAIQWQKCLGGTGSDDASSIQQTTDGGYIVIGTTSSYNGDVSGYHDDTTQFLGDYWVVKLNTNGAIQWQKCLGGTDFEEAHSIQQTTDGGYIIAGRTVSNDGDVSGNHSFQDDYWIVKLSPYNGINEQESIENHLHIYPNPLTSSSILQLNTQLIPIESGAEVVIYDVLGKEMLRKKLMGDRMEIEKGSLERGIYFVRVSSKDGQWVEKLVVE